jgi:hypothetical protein
MGKRNVHPPLIRLGEDRPVWPHLEIEEITAALRHDEADRPFSGLVDSPSD